MDRILSYLWYSTEQNDLHTGQFQLLQMPWHQCCCVFSGVLQSKLLQFLTHCRPPVLQTSCQIILTSYWKSSIHLLLTLAHLHMHLRQHQLPPLQASRCFQMPGRVYVASPSYPLFSWTQNRKYQLMCWHSWLQYRSLQHCRKYCR